MDEYGPLILDRVAQIRSERGEERAPSVPVARRRRHRRRLAGVGRFGDSAHDSMNQKHGKVEEGTANLLRDLSRPERARSEPAPCYGG
jgi:hypothetical protein